jgi:hypothetical protein
MNRLHDWQMRFAEFARGRRNRAFEWGGNDCFLFAADAVLAITGADPAGELRGAYASALQAARILRARGGMAALGGMFGTRIAPLMANVGDVVLVDMGGRETFGVCNGTSVIGPGPAGLASCGMGIATAAWRVG